MCICDPMTGRVCALHQDLLRRARAEGFDATARAAGWVPLAEVLDTLRDRAETIALGVAERQWRKMLAATPDDQASTGDVSAALALVAEVDRYARECALAGPRTWQLPDEPGLEVKAVRDRSGRIWDRDDGGWRYRVSGNIPGVRGTWRRWDGLLVTEGPLTDATPAETGRAPARIDGDGRTGAGAGERVDDAQDDSGGRDG